MSSMLSLFSFQDFDKLDLEVFDFCLLTELFILEWFSICFSNHPEFPYIHIFKLQSIYDQVYGHFPQYRVLKIVVGRLRMDYIGVYTQERSWLGRT